MSNIKDGGSVANYVNVTDTYDVKVNTPTSPSVAGFAAMVAESDSGTVRGTRFRRRPRCGEDYRLRAAISTPDYYWSVDNGTAGIAGGKITQLATTMTAVPSGQALILNQGASVAASVGVGYRTWRSFSLFGRAPSIANFWVREVNHTAVNATSEWGFGLMPASIATATLNDGCVFRRTSGGALRAAITYGGNEIWAVDINTTNIPSRDGRGIYDPNEVNLYRIQSSMDSVTFWVNDVMVARRAVANALAVSAQSQPMFFRVFNSAATSVARQLAMYAFSHVIGDFRANKPWGHLRSEVADSSQTPDPISQTSTTGRGSSQFLGWPNSAVARTAGTWTATSAPALSALSGQWRSSTVPALISDGDYPVFAYPAITGRTFYVTGIKWGNIVVSTAAAVNASTWLLIAILGSTIAGTQSIVLDTLYFPATAAVGDYREGGFIDLSQNPVPCTTIAGNNTYVGLVARPAGTFTSNTLVLDGSWTVTGYWE